MSTARIPSLAAALLLCLAALPAQAQYVWIDDKGVKQFSDMPPPANVPKDRILRQPAGGFTPRQEAPAPAAPVAASTPAAPMTTAERNADFKKRQADREEAAKKAMEQAKFEADQKANCERMDTYRRSLESGERITQTGKSGEREFLSDEQRARELREVQARLKDCKR